MNEEQKVSSSQHKANVAAWKEIVLKYQEPSLGSATWQMTNSIGSYFLIWYFMYLSSSRSLLLTFALAILQAALIIRIFVIFHDCGHGSFFKSKTANNVVGFICGVICFTPYFHWRWEHSIHHASAGHLDRRGTGDIWTMTVQEYLESSRWKRFAYRLARNPFVLFVLAPLYLFLLRERFPTPGAPERERLSVYWTNICLVLAIWGLSSVFGFKLYALLQLVISAVSGAMGIWLFYIQHQFEDVYWERGEDWDYTAAALQGSSFYKLPKILQWFSGNIGFHHVHHLSAKIPNYNLERCHKADPLFQSVKPITLFSSLRSFSYRLWDEQQRKLVGYKRLRELRKQEKRVST